MRAWNVLRYIYIYWSCTCAVSSLSLCIYTATESEREKERIGANEMRHERCQYVVVVKNQTLRPNAGHQHFTQAPKRLQLSTEYDWALMIMRLCVHSLTIIIRLLLFFFNLLHHLCTNYFLFSHRDNIDDHLESDHRLTSSNPIENIMSQHNIHSQFLSISTSFSACHAKFIINLNLETFELISVFILFNLQVKALKTALSFEFFPNRISSIQMEYKNMSN